MPTHTTLSGHVITFEDDPPGIVRFLDRLQSLVDDRASTEGDAIALAYSRENPLLAHQDIFPTRGAVTKETLAHPAYAVVTDLLARKEVAVRGIDVAKMAAAYTIPISEAAKRLGVHESAVRQAIAARRLPSWVKDGKHFLSERSLASFARGAQGPKPSASPMLTVRIGNHAGASFRLFVEGGELASNGARSTEEPHIFEATVPKWTSAAVITGRKGSHRLFFISPGVEENEIVFETFFVKGRFNIDRKVNHPDDARAEWQNLTRTRYTLDHGDNGFRVTVRERGKRRVFDERFRSAGAALDAISRIEGTPASKLRELGIVQDGDKKG